MSRLNDGKQAVIIGGFNHDSAARSGGFVCAVFCGKERLHVQVGNHAASPLSHIDSRRPGLHLPASNGSALNRFAEAGNVEFGRLPQ